MIIMISSRSPVQRTTITVTKGAFTRALKVAIRQANRPTRSTLQVAQPVKTETLAPRTDADVVVADVDTETECQRMSRHTNMTGRKTWSIHNKVCQRVWFNTPITRFADQRTSS